MAKRGLIILVLVWSVLLLLPAFRYQSLRAKDTAPVEKESFFIPDFYEAELKELADKNPNDGILAREKLRLEFPYRDAPYWRALDAEIARLPNDLQLRRAKMLDASMGSLIVPVYQPDYTDQSAMPTQKERREQAYKWLDPAQRATLVEQARKGAQQTPDDGFFRWMEAVVLWNVNDEPALRALKKAAQTSEFESGDVANQLALMRWEQTQRNLEWDEKLNYLYATLLPQYAKFNELNREIIWSGIAHYRRGDKVGAYRRWEIALEAADAMRRAQLRNPHSLVIGLRVAEGLQTAVWNLVALEIGGLAENATKDQKFAAFIALARRDGQMSLADESLRERADFQSQKIFPDDADFPVAQNAYQSALGINRTDTRLQLQLPWASRNVYWLSVAGAIALLVCAGLSWFERGLHREFMGGVSVGQIAFFGALWLGFLGLAVVTREGKELWMLSGGDSSSPASNFAVDFFDSAPLFWLAIAATCVLCFAFCYGQHALEERHLREQTLKSSGHHNTRFILAWILGISSLILAICIDLFFSLKNADRAPLELAWLFLTLLTLGLIIWNIQHSSSVSARELRSRLTIAGAFAAATYFGLVLHFGFKNNWTADVFIVSSALWFVGLSLYLVATDKSWRPLFPRAVTVALQTLGGVAAVCSIALLLASLAALPVRARQNRIVDDYIARGEIDWMRSQPKIRRAAANQS